MTTTHVDSIDRSAEKAHIWLKDLAAELGDDDRHYAYRVMRAFLHALRDRLTVDETAQLSAQLPIFVRGVFYEGRDPGRTPKHHRELDSFLSQIAERAELTGETEASFAASAAAKVLRHHVSGGEIESVLHVLPAAVRELVRELLSTNETVRTATPLTCQGMACGLVSLDGDAPVRGSFLIRKRGRLLPARSCVERRRTKRRPPRWAERSGSLA